MNNTINGVIYYQYIYFSMLGKGILNDGDTKSLELNSLLCSFFHSGLVDRTSTLEQGFKTIVLDPIPNFSLDKSNNPSFEELCDIRAKEIIDQSKTEQRPIYVFWSGGIDSTTALVALLRNMNDIDIKKYLTVYLNTESIAEYSGFYRDFIENKLNTKTIDDSFCFLNGNPLIVTGELGDQLFGSVSMIDLLKLDPRANSIDVLKESYEVALPKLIQYRLKTNSSEIVTKLFDYLVPLIKKCPWEITTIFDCLWWMNLTLKWQHVDLRFATGFHKDLSEIEKIYKLCNHFFKTNEFQRWSVLNPDMKIKDSWDSYKFPAKEYIYSYTNDTDYLKNKQKIPSLSMREIQQSFHCFLLNDFTMIKARDTKNIDKYMKEQGQRYDWIFNKAS